jgi:hypothetical protein
MEAVGMIVKVVQEIVKAAETARQNRKRCLDLADRARTVGDILREDRDSATSSIAGGGAMMRKPPLERLKAALDDALELVESQRRSGLGIPKLITSGRTAAKFQDVETRITACVVDLGLAEQIAARRRNHPANAEAAPVQEPPPPQQQQGKDVHSLRQGYPAQSAKPLESLYNQCLEQQKSLLQAYLPQSAPPPPQHSQSTPPPESLYSQCLEQQQSLLQCYLGQSAPSPAQSLLQGYLGQSTQQGRDAQSFLQDYLAQSAQQGKDAQSFLQGYLAQSAQEAKDAQPFLQGNLAQSAQESKDAQSFLQSYLAQSAPSPQQGKDVQSLLNGYFAM